MANCVSNVINAPIKRKHTKEKIQTSQSDHAASRMPVHRRRAVSGGRLEGTDPKLGTVSSKTREKRLFKDLSKLMDKYDDLGKRYENVLTERRELSDTLERREAEYQKLWSHYEKLAEKLVGTEEAKFGLASSNRKLEMENCRSREDVALLKNIVYRLNTELERYQDKLKEWERKRAERTWGHSFSDVAERGKEDESYAMQAWRCVKFHALGPLLNAYQENLEEKKNLVAMYDREIVDFAGRCKDILCENDLLHKEVECLTSKCDRYADEMGTLVENVECLKKENDVLLRDIAEQKKRAEQSRASYKQKIEFLCQHNETLGKERARNLSELCNLRGKYEILCEQLEKATSKEKNMLPVTAHTAAIEECKKLFEQLKQRYEAEKKGLYDRLRTIEENKPDNRKRLSTVTAERNHLKFVAKSHERRLRRNQREIEYMQTVVHSTRVSCVCLKEKLATATAFCEELFSEYERIVTEREKLLIRLHETDKERESEKDKDKDKDKESAGIDRLEKSIIDRVDSLKKQLEIVRKGAKQHVATIEKRMILQEYRVRRMKREYRRKVRSLRNMVKLKEERFGKSKERENERKNSEMYKQMDSEKYRPVD